MASVVNQVTLDALDPYGLAGFWAQALGGERDPGDVEGDPEVLVRAGTTRLLLCVVPEPHAVKNRMHLDLVPDVPREQGSPASPRSGRASWPTGPGPTAAAGW